MRKPVAILGAGPAGLLAAHAFATAGYPTAIITAPDQNGHPAKSRIGGAQFMHAAIPGIPMQKYGQVIEYMVRGDASTYRRKVYGGAHPSTVPFVSFSSVDPGQRQTAYPMIETYNWLWNMFMQSIVGNMTEIDWTVVDQMVEKNLFSHIISSVPAPVLCRVPNIHTFASQEIKVWNECVIEGLPDNRILYNGNESPSWYRTSKLFGHGSTEWPGHLDPPLSGVTTLRKPLFTNCDCYAGQVHRVGRMSKWTKGVLAHEAFTDALDIIRGS